MLVSSELIHVYIFGQVPTLGGKRDRDASVWYKIVCKHNIGWGANSWQIIQTKLKRNREEFGG